MDNKKNFEKYELSKKGHRFLLSQFQTLSAHIDTLISSSTMRLYSFLLVWTIVVSVYSLLLKASFYVILQILIFLFLLVIGGYMLNRQIDCSTKIVGYFRIINRIRGFYNEDNPTVGELCNPLPVTDRKPESIKRIFDPGFFIIEVLNATAFAILLDTLFVEVSSLIFRKYIVLRYFIGGITFGIFMIAQIITVKVKEKKQLKS